MPLPGADIPADPQFIINLLRSGQIKMNDPRLQQQAMAMANQQPMPSRGQPDTALAPGPELSGVQMPSEMNDPGMLEMPQPGLAGQSAPPQGVGIPADMAGGASMQMPQRPPEMPWGRQAALSSGGMNADVQAMKQQMDLIRALKGPQVQRKTKTGAIYQGIGDLADTVGQLAMQQRMAALLRRKNDLDQLAVGSEYGAKDIAMQNQLANV